MAATPEAKSADWSAVAAPLTAASKANVPGVYFFAKPDGTYWTTASGLQKATVRDRDYFQAALAGRTTVGELVRSKSTGKEVAVIAIPVRGTNGAVVGVLGGSVFLNELSAQLVREMGLGTGVAFFAVDAKVVIALHSDPTNIVTEPSKISPELDAIGRKMIENELGVQTYVFRGKKRTMLFVRSKLTGWRFGFGIVH
ncbi:MAG: cache domain-containing protein [Candidatus Eremiobacteraeota bacterium]|nr:cache domain-containing protein [Candidatus Eremiobacteraeota bacterium]